MARLTDLLIEARHDGYPDDFVLARLRSRQGAFAGSCPVGGPEEAWRHLQSEYLWLYDQVDHRLRQQLAPIFLFLELKNIFAALRFTEARDRLGRDRVLKESMLSPAFKAVFREEAPLSETLETLAGYLSTFDSGFHTLPEAYRQQGMAGLEKALLKAFLAALDREKPALEIKAFLLRLLERRDLVLLAKESRWQLGDSYLPLLQGSSRRQLRKVWRSLAGQTTPENIDPANLDNRIVRALAVDVRRQGRSGTKISSLIAYIWACYLAARNCGVRSLEELLGKSRVQEETV